MEVFRTGEEVGVFLVVEKVVVVVRVVVVVGLGVVVRIGIGLEVVVFGFLSDFCLNFRVFCCNRFHQGIVVWMGDLEVEVVVDGVVIWFHQVLIKFKVVVTLAAYEEGCNTLCICYR